jgi:hypothetical protein
VIFLVLSCSGCGFAHPVRSGHTFLVLIDGWPTLCWDCPDGHSQLTAVTTAPRWRELATAGVVVWPGAEPPEPIEPPMSRRTAVTAIATRLLGRTRKGVQS